MHQDGLAADEQELFGQFAPHSLSFATCYYYDIIHCLIRFRTLFNGVLLTLRPTFRLSHLLQLLLR